MDFIQEIPRIQEAQNSNIEIFVLNPVINNENFQRQVTYEVKGQDSLGQFGSLRKYSEFITLRNILIQKWPGHYIPPVPPKKLMGSFSLEFLETRRKHLEYFLQQSSKINIFYTTEEYQLFLRGPADFDKLMNQFKYTIRDISDKYKQVYEECTKVFVTTQMADQIAEYENLFKENLNKLLDFKNVVKEVHTRFDAFQKQFCSFNAKMACLESEYIGEIMPSYSKIYSPIEKNEIENPFHEIYEWVKIEILDLEAILETISKKSEIETQRAKIEEKIKKENVNLKDLQAGKTKFLNLLNTKPKSDQAAEIESTIKELEADIIDHSCILRIIVVRLFETVLPEFKLMKSKVYKDMMKTYGRISLLAFQNFTDSAKQINWHSEA